MKTWTVNEMIDELRKAKRNSKIEILDADTGYIIPQFDITWNKYRQVYVIEPCDYSDMVTA